TIVLCTCRVQLKPRGEALPSSRRVLIHFFVLLAVSASFAEGIAHPRKSLKKRTVRRAASLHLAVRNVAFAGTVKPTANAVTRITPATTTSKKIVSTGPWRVPNYADSTAGDFIDGEDLIARRAAVEGLGRLNGSVVVADASTGRILSIVNQRL